MLGAWPELSERKKKLLDVDEETSSHCDLCDMGLQMVAV